jgi:hypothetical protein
MDFTLSKNALAVLLSSNGSTTSINHHFTSNINNIMRFEIVHVFNNNSDDDVDAAVTAEVGKL